MALRIVWKQSLETRSLQAGFTLLEPVILIVMLTIAMITSMRLYSSAMQTYQSSQNVNRVELAIDQDLASINTLSRSFTCCSGECLAAAPAAKIGSGKACATAGTNSALYYFPKQNDTGTTTNFANTTTADEPAAVDQLCSVSNNTNFMTPFKTAVDALTQSGFTRTTTIRSDILHTLLVQYSDPANSTRGVVRSVTVVPVMASYCP